jgi:proteasome alpha subunit
MIGEEPYRWLEAIQNRREYIEDQLRSGQPIVAISGLPGILILTIRRSTPKLFEVYDHLAMGCLGHPADIERARQAAIDAAHLEGFARSPRDVGARRLVNYNLAPALKAAFEQIFAAPLIFRGLLAELGASPDHDQIWHVDYDGGFMAASSGERLSGVLASSRKSTHVAHLARQIPPETPPADDWAGLASAGLRLLAWARASDAGDCAADGAAFPVSALSYSQLECAILDRRGFPRSAYRIPDAATLGISAA